MWAVELIDVVKLLEARARRRLLQHVAHISMGWARGARQNTWYGVREAFFEPLQLHVIASNHPALGVRELL